MLGLTLVTGVVASGRLFLLSTQSQDVDVESKVLEINQIIIVFIDDYFLGKERRGEGEKRVRNEKSVNQKQRRWRRLIIEIQLTI